MKFSISDEKLEKAVMYFSRPALFYLAACMCWVWLEKDDNFGYADAMALPIMITVGIYWNFSAPPQSNQLRYQWFTYFIPILLATLGLVFWYVFQPA